MNLPPVSIDFIAEFGYKYLNFIAEIEIYDPAPDKLSITLQKNGVFEFRTVGCPVHSLGRPGCAESKLETYSRS